MRGKNNWESLKAFMQGDKSKENKLEKYKAAKNKLKQDNDSLRDELKKK